eukprot:m.2522 g.2522  ORF g.2522 m.2522 type:complete len:86 (-) comp2619_c0_seq2:362-619(-)
MTSPCVLWQRCRRLFLDVECVFIPMSIFLLVSLCCVLLGIFGDEVLLLLLLRSCCCCSFSPFSPFPLAFVLFEEIIVFRGRFNKR